MANCRRTLVLLQCVQRVYDSFGTQELARTSAEDRKCWHGGYPPINSLRFARLWRSRLLNYCAPYHQHKYTTQIEMNFSYIRSSHQLHKPPVNCPSSSWRCPITRRKRTIGCALNHWCSCWMSPRSRPRRSRNGEKNGEFRFPPRISGHGCQWPKWKRQRIRSN